MNIKFWGSRGSIPVSGPQFIKYGGDTACVEIRTKNDEVIIVDTGTGVRELGNRLIDEKKKRIHIIFTHAHWDHIIGFPFFKPLYVTGTRIVIAGCSDSQIAINNIISNVMEPPFFPVKLAELKSAVHFAGTCQESITIDSIKIFPINLNHPNNAIGYKFIEDGKTFVYLTDNEIGFKESGSKKLAFRHPTGMDYGDYVSFSKGADLLVHDGEFTHEEYHRNRMSWGHSCSRDVIDLAMDAGVKRLGLFHINQDRSDAEVDAMVDECVAALKSRHSAMACSAIAQGDEITL
ncbi:MAG: MBL fold metallo-hydrolase [Spirochaetes bacterium]|nr:MBL fold metallo-hydrolase [Spirochaetota bacterium]